MIAPRIQVPCLLLTILPREGKAASWQNLLIQKDCFQFRKLRKHSATIQSTLAGSCLKGKLKHGVSAILGQPLKKQWKNIYVVTRGPEGRAVNEPLKLIGKRLELVVEIETQVTIIQKRDGRVRKHSPTAKYTRNSVSEARDLGAIVLNGWRGSTASLAGAGALFAPSWLQLRVSLPQGGVL